MEKQVVVAFRALKPASNPNGAPKAFHPGGFKAISRWLRRFAPIPPDYRPTPNRIPEGCQTSVQAADLRGDVDWHPSGMTTGYLVPTLRVGQP